MAQRTSITSYFEAVDRRRVKLIAADEVRFIRVCGRLIKLVFQSADQADQMLLSLTGTLCVPAQDEEIDATFIFWMDDLSNYMPEGSEGQLGVWTSEDETGYLHLATGYGLMGADYARRRFYLCLNGASDDEVAVNNHAMIVAFFRWALQSDMLLVHAAAVGAEGQGVLIAGRGGRGKSTLSVASLFAGLDFVSDDYTLLTADGELCAMPLYRTIGLNPDMAEMLGADLPVLRADERRGGKLLLDASSRPFSEQLPIKAIIFPDRSGEGLPEGAQVPVLEPVHPGQALTQLVHSTLAQFDVMRDIKIVQAMMARLRGLPVYKLHLGLDPLENALYLKRCITEVLPHNRKD